MEIWHYSNLFLLSKFAGKLMAKENRGHNLCCTEKFPLATNPPWTTDIKQPAWKAMEYLVTIVSDKLVQQV